MKKRVRISAAPNLFQFYLDEILAFVADGNYSKAILSDGEEFLIARQLGQIEKMIESQVPKDESCLERVGRSLLINVDYIIKIDTSNRPQVILKSRHEKVSRTFKPSREAVQALHQCMML